MNNKRVNTTILMKSKKKQRVTGNSQVNGRQVVRVEFKQPAANAVAIAGTFNDWRPEATPMVPMGDGRWLKELALPPGTYEYLFVADGRWVADPLASASVPNPFGGVNSVIIVSRDQNRNVEAKPSSALAQAR